MRNSAQFFRVRQFELQPVGALALLILGARFFRSSYSTDERELFPPSPRPALLSLIAHIPVYSSYPFSRSCSPRMKVHIAADVDIAWRYRGERRADICLTLIGKCFDLSFQHSSRLLSFPRVWLSGRQLTSRLKVVHRCTQVPRTRIVFQGISSSVISFVLCTRSVFPFSSCCVFPVFPASLLGRVVLAFGWNCMSTLMHADAQSPKWFRNRTFLLGSIYIMTDGEIVSMDLSIKKELFST